MYRIPGFLNALFDLPAEEFKEAELFCAETDMNITLYTNRMQEALAAYSYTLVGSGSLDIVYNGHALHIKPGSLYIYSPGGQVSIAGGSRNYHAICLIADEMMTFESTVVRNIIRSAFDPRPAPKSPVLELSREHAGYIWRRMEEIARYSLSSHLFKKEGLRSLYDLFLLDIMDARSQVVPPVTKSERTADLYLEFMRMLPDNFAEHHDIAYYAERLCITTTHLSRIVRGITGHTVAGAINQMLMMEALWMLRDSSLSIAEIAERLHFADQSSFSKFFSRMRGIPPGEYRKLRSPGQH